MHVALFEAADAVEKYPLGHALQVELDVAPIVLDHVPGIQLLHVLLVLCPAPSME